MTPTTFLNTAALIPSVAKHPFLTAFFVALLITAKPYLPVSPEAWFIQAIPAAPAWFTHIFALTAFGVVGLIEVGISHIPDVRNEVEGIYNFVRGAMGFVVSLSLLDPETEMLLTPLANPDVTAFQVAWSSFMATVTWLIGVVRTKFYDMLKGLDEDDDLGLQRSLLWLEDLGVPFGVILAIFMPVVALTLFGLTILGLWLVQLYFNRREIAQQTPCANCNQSIHPAAVICHHCGHRNAQPRQVGVFGQVKETVAHNPVNHRLNLLARKRCPVCASRLSEKSVQQTCGTCQTVTFSTFESLQTYAHALQPKLFSTAGICLVLSFIPILGLVPGIIYYRLSLVASLRRYLPRRTGCLTRWGVRALNLSLIVLQPIPGVGAVTLPLMCISNFYIYSGVLLSEGQKKITTDGVGMSESMVIKGSENS